MLMIDDLSKIGQKESKKKSKNLCRNSGLYHVTMPELMRTPVLGGAESELTLQMRRHGHLTSGATESMEPGCGAELRLGDRVPFKQGSQLECWQNFFSC